jgi:hypothetical protein
MLLNDRLFFSTKSLASFLILGKIFRRDSLEYIKKVVLLEKIEARGSRAT